jgi:phosphoglycolate phosphatase
LVNTIILDLDGPLLDGRFRHYACYESILLSHGYQPLPLPTYWEMKRSRVDRLQQLAATGASEIYDIFLQTWIEKIESPEMLLLDRVQEGAQEKLQQWRSDGKTVVLATLRRHPDRVLGQLNRLGLSSFLDQVVVCDTKRGGLGKAEQVRSEVASLETKDCIWIGDSEADLEGARSLGCRVWLISGGIRAKSYLESLSPDFLTSTLREVDLGRCRES